MLSKTHASINNAIDATSQHAGAVPNQYCHDSALLPSKDLLNFNVSWCQNGDCHKDTIDSLSAVNGADVILKTPDCITDPESVQGQERGRQLTLPRQPSQVSLKDAVKYDLEAAEEWLRRDSSVSGDDHVGANRDEEKIEESERSFVMALRVSLLGFKGDVEREGEVGGDEEDLVGEEGSKQEDEAAKNGRGEQTDGKDAMDGEERATLKGKWCGVVSKASTVFRG